MRVLWFSVTPSLFNPHTNSHNGGGWIASLEQIIRNEKSIDLGVAFNFPDKEFKYNNEGVTYYPIYFKERSIINRAFCKNNELHKRLDKYLEIINDFNPDLIQIFGSENDFGEICKITKIPVVIHMQGCIPPYYNAVFPIGMNKYDFYFTPGLSFSKRIMGFRTSPSFKLRAEKEIDIIKSCKYFMGRTEWDNGLVSLFNPDAKYFHCEEALRDSFLRTEKKWEYLGTNKIKLISVISNPWYKGVDLILKTAKLLKNFTELDFEWNVYGVSDIRFYENKYKIKAKDVNININGTASKEQLVDALCTSSIYIHTSYIDNSPNSLCEAQYLGIPILATHVGGIPSLVRDGETGILFPANAPYTLASLVKKLFDAKDVLKKLSCQERETAKKRHNPESIKDSLLSIYNKIINDK